MTPANVYRQADGLSEKQFQKICALVNKASGIKLKAGKEALVKTRLNKRLRVLGMQNFETYIKHIESAEGKQEFAVMIDQMTTNKTSFFREVAHFDFLRASLLPKLKHRPMRLWSAACSSGEEPFSLALLLKEELEDIDTRNIRILATDISTRMLERASRTIYGEGTLRDLPKGFLQKYFIPVDKESPRTYQLRGDIRAMVQLSRLNLMGPWPMTGPFNIIFCRNVMIYFDRDTQQRLINRFWDLLAPGGFLFVGHSEGLSALSHKFQYIQPATYKK